MKAYDAFQNSMKGLIGLYQNFNKGNLTLQFAIATNPKKPNEIKKGDKIYDYDNARWFALNESECNQILMWLNQVFSGNVQQDKIEIKHYPQNAMTVLTVGYNTQNQSFYIAFSEIQNKQQTFHLALGLGPADILTFKNFLSTISMVKTLSAFEDWRQWSSNRQNGNGYNNRQQNNQQPQAQQQTNQTSSPAPTPPSNPFQFLA